MVTYLFNKQLIQMHNLKIMEKKIFSEVFEDTDLLILYLNYYGTFDFNIIDAGKNSLKCHILKICNYLQFILNLVFRLLFKKKRI